MGLGTKRGSTVLYRNKIERYPPLIRRLCSAYEVLQLQYRGRYNNFLETIWGTLDRSVWICFRARCCEAGNVVLQKGYGVLTCFFLETQSACMDRYFNHFACMFLVGEQRSQVASAKSLLRWKFWPAHLVSGRHGLPQKQRKPFRSKGLG